MVIMIMFSANMFLKGYPLKQRIHQKCKLVEKFFFPMGGILVEGITGNIPEKLF